MNATTTCTGEAIRMNKLNFCTGVKLIWVRPLTDKVWHPAEHDEEYPR